jgi:hypothetical protein
VRAKSNVIIAGASFEIGFACGVAVLQYEQLFHRELVVTSVKDSTHNPGSLHPKGQAADFRTRDLSDHDKASFVRVLRQILNPRGFDLVLESDHLHIEFDPKAGETFLEVVA